MERSQLVHFVAVVEAGGFNRAARALHVSQPALSKSIKSLESELGIQLFQRSPAGAQISSAGKKLIQRARSIIRDMDDFARAAQGDKGQLLGSVDVALSPGPVIEPTSTIVAQLHEVHPLVRFNGIGHSNSQSALEAMIHSETDVAIFGQIESPESPGAVFHIIAHQEVIIVAPSESTLAQRGPVAVSDLTGQSFVLPPRSTNVRREFEQMSIEIGDYTVVAEASHREALLPMVARGLGITLLPSAWTELVEAMGFRALHLDPPIKVPIWLGYQPAHSPAAGAFIRAALAWSELTSKA